MIECVAEGRFGEKHVMGFDCREYSILFQPRMCVARLRLEVCRTS